MPPAAPNDPAPLTTFARGQDVRIEWIGLSGPEAERLRDLGVREGCTACIMMNADKCILGLGSCRLALQREVAMQLFAILAADRADPSAESPDAP
jgi:Fe2+ transport system protein FeoA